MGQRGPAPSIITIDLKKRGAIERAMKAQELKKKGYTLAEICAEVGRSKRMIAYYLRADLRPFRRREQQEAERLKRMERSQDIGEPARVVQLRKNVDVIVFSEDPAYLNFRLNPMQKLILKAFYGVKLTDEERAMLEQLAKEGKTTWEEGQKYRELVVVAGMKGGKTILASVIACYEEFSLYCLGEPWEKYGFPEGEKIYIINVATSGAQAEDTIYAQTLARIKHSPFYNDFRPYEEIGKTVSFKDNGVKIRCGHSNSASIVGKLAKLVLFDELARFKDKGGKSSAEAVYTALTRSVEPFGEDGKIVDISSPMWEKDKIMSLYRVSKEIPNMLGFWLATWVMNPKITKESLKWEFKKNPEAAQRDFGADPSKPKEAYYRIPSRVEAMFEKCKEHPSPIDSKGRLKDDFQPNPEFDYYLHGDPAARNDAFGLSLAHRLGDRVIIDLAHGFEAVGGGEIDVEEIKNIILELIKRGFKIKKATFDTWGAVVVWQALKAKGISPENLYVLKEQHDELKLAIYQDYLEGHFPGKLRDEIKALLLLRGMKVDHPAGGSKDIADAVAAVTWQCMQEEVVEVASGGKDPEQEERRTEGRLFGRRRLWM